MKSKLRKVKKAVVIGAICIFVGLIAVLVYQFFHGTVKEMIVLLEHGNKDELFAYLQSQNEIEGLFSIFVLTILQVISIFFPGMIIHVVAGVIYGWWKAFIACYVGFLFANGIVFYLARRFSWLMQSVLNLEKKDSWIMLQINKTKPSFVFALACMIPGIPNGLIPYIASRSDIRLLTYLKAVCVSCWMQILSNCIIGHFLIRGEYTYMFISFVVQLCIILLALYKRDWFLMQGKKDTVRV